MGNPRSSPSRKDPATATDPGRVAKDCLEAQRDPKTEACDKPGCKNPFCFAHYYFALR
jgi:hypothetical protein